jgi:hypothetical protein
MNHLIRVTGVFLCISFSQPILAESLAKPFIPPDGAAILREGKGYRYSRDGWIYLHIEGKPFDRGYQHGKLLGPEIGQAVRRYARTQSADSPEVAWQQSRQLINAVFLRGFDREYLEEMQGIAEGASDAGAKFSGRKLDLIDIVGLNLWPELDTLESALAATPTGLEGIDFPKPAVKVVPKPKVDHCSSFIATGPATKDGKIVFGHITMYSLYPSHAFNVWIDVQPEKGFRVTMQGCPGSIQSGMDYYVASSGMVVSETTIGQTRFELHSKPLANRIRKALQYGNSIDEVVAILKEGNNGLYTNEWLIGDTKTNEIAMFELGTKSTKLLRSSKNEWFGDTPGFYWGCNNTKDLQVRLETLASLEDRPSSVAWRTSERDKAWLKFYAENRGKIDLAAGKRAFTTAPLAAYTSLDAKLTDSNLIKSLTSIAVFGPPSQPAWMPSDEDVREFHDIEPLIGNVWTTLTPLGKIGATEANVVDVKEIHDFGIQDVKNPPETERVYRGTLLPAKLEDHGVTNAFAEFERYLAIQLLPDLEASEKTRFRNLTLNKCRYDASLSIKSAGAEGNIFDLENDRWQRKITAEAFLQLESLREKLGNEKLRASLAQLGKANAGKVITKAEFFKSLGNESPQPLAALSSKPHIMACFGELDQTVIVAGLTPASQVTAERLQELIRRRFLNVKVPIVSCNETLPKDLHLIFVGGPADNPAVTRYRDCFAAKIGNGTFTLEKDVYVHPGSAFIAAGINPEAKGKAVILFHALSAQSLYRLPSEWLSRSRQFAGNVMVAPVGKPRVDLVID